MIILPTPVTKAAVLAEVERYVATMAKFKADNSTGKPSDVPLPRWMRLTSRPAFVLRHGGQYNSKWKIIRRGSVAAAAKTFELMRGRYSWGGLALVALAYQGNSIVVASFWTTLERKSPRAP